MTTTQTASGRKVTFNEVANTVLRASSMSYRDYRNGITIVTATIRDEQGGLAFRTLCETNDIDTALDCEEESIGRDWREIQAAYKGR